MLNDVGTQERNRDNGDILNEIITNINEEDHGTLDDKMEVADLTEEKEAAIPADGGNEL